MMVRRFFLSALGAVTLCAPAHAQAPAQPPAQAVEVAPLAAPDFFSTGARDTGLSPDLWRGASGETVRTVLPLIAARPLSPAARALAARLLATGGPGPEGAGQDPALAGARINALIALGDVADAQAILARTSGVERDPGLAQAAAEAALLAGDEARACAVSDRLANGRGEIYWLRLRAFCGLRAGQADAARLTFDLAQSQAKDPTYGRLMGAKLGLGAPGAASLRGGLDYALSKSLGLDLSKAQASPAAAAVVSPRDPWPAIWSIPGGPGPARAAMAVLASGDLTGAQKMRAGLAPGGVVDVTDLALLDAMIAAASGQPAGPTLDLLIDRGVHAEPKTRIRPQTGALLLVALGTPMSAPARGAFAGFTTGEVRAPAARVLALDLAGEGRLVGETALLALRIAAEAGLAGPTTGDRSRIIRALRAAGLEADARAFALEGLLAVR